MRSFTRERVLAELRRMAINGEAPGLNAFLKVVPGPSWRGRFWARYSDLVREAGFEPRGPNIAQDASLLFERLVPLIRKLGRWPTEPEQQIERHLDSTFPSVQTMRARFGSRAEVIAKVRDHCSHRPDLADVEEILRSNDQRTDSASGDVARRGRLGSVYLMKSGKRHKIGFTYAIYRRANEIRLPAPRGIHTRPLLRNR